jgi:hypothetical protein
LLCRLRLWLLLFLLLLLLLLLFLFCEVMSDSTTGRRANDAMMASHVPCYAPYNGTLDATFRLGTVRAYQEHKTHQGCGKRLHLHCHTLRHTFTPSFRPQIGLYTLKNTAVLPKLQNSLPRAAAPSLPRRLP